MKGRRLHVLAAAFLAPLALLAVTAVLAFAQGNSALAASAAVTFVTMATFGVLTASLCALAIRRLRSVIALRVLGVCGVAIGSVALFGLAFRYRLSDVAVGTIHGLAINLILAMGAVVAAMMLEMILRNKNNAAGKG